MWRGGKEEFGLGWVASKAAQISHLKKVLESHKEIFFKKRKDEKKASISFPTLIFPMTAFAFPESRIFFLAAGAVTQRRKREKKKRH